MQRIISAAEHYTAFGYHNDNREILRYASFSVSVEAKLLSFYFNAWVPA